MRMKLFINAILRNFGLKLVRTLEPHGRKRTTKYQTKLNSFLENLAHAPLDPDTHLAYAIEAARCDKPYLAYAELKSAEFLGADPDRVAACKPSILHSIPDVMSMNHNQYFRFASLAAEIKAKAAGTEISVLDVGGGHGELASFIQDARYCLCEPSINGISGNDLPFADRSFDYVVACHVLEHIPIDARESFLDQLLSKSRRGVILLNPFYIQDTCVKERLTLFYEITGEQWAKEHLDCTLPRLESIELYARKNKIYFEIKPNGSLAASTALVFMDYFAGLAHQYSQWSRINVFFNSYFTLIMNSPDYPNAYMIYLTCDV